MGGRDGRAGCVCARAWLARLCRLHLAASELLAAPLLHRGAGAAGRVPGARGEAGAAAVGAAGQPAHALVRAGVADRPPEHRSPAGALPASSTKPASPSTRGRSSSPSGAPCAPSHPTSGVSSSAGPHPIPTRASKLSRASSKRPGAAARAIAPRGAKVGVCCQSALARDAAVAFHAAKRTSARTPRDAAGRLSSLTEAGGAACRAQSAPVSGVHRARRWRRRRRSGSSYGWTPRSG